MGTTGFWCGIHRKVKKFIYASSCSVYGFSDDRFSIEEDPTFTQHPYGISKLQGEQGVLQIADKNFKVINPATGQLIIEVPDFGKKETAQAINAAELAFKSWSKLTAHERSKILKKWYDLVIENQDDLATIMTAEQGKPLLEAKGEIIYAANFIEWFAEEAKRVY